MRRLVLLVLLAACSRGTSEVSSSPSPALRRLVVSTGALSPAFEPGVTDYTVTSLNSLEEVAVTASVDEAGAAVSVQGLVAASDVAVPLRLQARQDIVVTVRRATGAERTYTVRYAPPDLPAYSVWSDGRAGRENVMLTPSGAFLLIVDRAGAPLYYRSFAPSQVLNFQQHLLAGGGTFYSAIVGTTDTAWTLGVAHLMDAQFHDVGDVQLLPNRGHGVLPCEAHDFRLLGDQHWVAMSYVPRIVDLEAIDPRWSATAPVMHGVVQEVDHGQVVFEWDSADVPSLYSDSTDGNTFTMAKVSDYLHLNSIDIDPRDGNFVLSFRHTDSIVKIDRATGKILWTLGGAEDDFHLADGQRFSHQHHARVQSDGSLTVFDNGNNAHPTRVISFVLDEEEREVKDFSVIYTKPADEPQTTFMGSAVRLDAARYLFGWGGWSTLPNAAPPPSVTELVDGTPAWSLTFDVANVYSYRALPLAPP